MSENVLSVSMENSQPKEELPACTLDIKRPDRTYITAWKDRSEFQAVYVKIFQSAADDIESKEEAVKWLNVWKVRQNRDIPICIRCTLVVLEGLLFDLRSQRDGRENTTETKNIYAGAFTRFINFLTEGSQNFRWKKQSIAEHVRGIGIEPYLVELRHLCSHRSVSVSIDVFRRSARYCLDWLRASYWERELSTMQPVTGRTIKCEEPLFKLPELTTTLRTYDLATAGRAMGFGTVSKLQGHLTRAELKLLQGFPTQKLKAISSLMVERLRERSALPHNSVGINALCNGLLTDCPRMLMGPVRKAEGSKPQGTDHLGAIHSQLFRYLAAFGCLNTFFQRLIAICENGNESDELRKAAADWAHRIAMSFQFLWLFKKQVHSLPLLVRFHELSKHKFARKEYRKWVGFLYGRVATERYIVFGFTVDCPWDLKLSAAYLRNRLSAVNPYTQELLPILLSFVQPEVIRRGSIEALMKIYIKQHNLDDFNDDGEPTDKIKPKKPKKSTSNESDKIFTKEDLAVALGKRQRADGQVENLEPVGKQIRRSGPWCESQAAIAWESCPLGTYHVPAKE